MPTVQSDMQMCKATRWALHFARLCAKRNAKRYPNLNVHHTQLWDKVDELTAGEDYSPNEFPDVDAYLSEEVAVRYIDDSGQLKSEIMSREHVLATFEKYSAYNPASQTERL